MVASACLVGLIGSSAFARKATMPPVKLDHIAVWVDDLDATARFLTDIVGWKRHPIEFGVPDTENKTGGIKLAFIDTNGFWLELVSPQSPGPARDVLVSKGDGAYGELAFEAQNYDQVLRAAQLRRIGLLNMDGSPLGRDGGSIQQSIVTEHGLEQRDLRIAYLPKGLSRGTAVEFYEYRPDVATDIYTIRNTTRQPAQFAPSTPRVDRIAIIVEDVKKSADFYTKVLGLKRHPTIFEMDGGKNARSGGMKVSFVNAGPVWLALVQPVGPGPLMDYLREKGDGHIAELIIEVDDIAAYYDQMKRKGIHLVDTRGNPLDDKEKAHVLQPFGDKIAYFPTSVSRGMVIEVSERGPRATSLIQRRDAWWNSRRAPMTRQPN